MSTNHSKTFRLRSLLLVFFLVISMTTIVACDSKEDVVTTQEFELVSCYIEHRNVTNRMGGVIRTEEYLHYGYIDADNKVIFDEMYLSSTINFKVTEETPKIIITNTNDKKTYTFELTREMYSNINASQK